MTARLQNGYYQGEIDGAFLFYFAAVLLFSDVMTFVLIVWNEKDERLKGENLTLTARARTQAESIEALSASYTAQRKLTHDLMRIWQRFPRIWTTGRSKTRRIIWQHCRNNRPTES